MKAEKEVEVKRSNSPFKEERKSSLLDGEIQISLSPRKLLKGSLFIVLLLAVFFFGRVSTEVSPSDIGNSISGMMTFESSEDTEVDENNDEDKEAEAIDKAEESTADEKAAELKVSTPKSDAQTKGSETVETVETETVEREEPIIKSYSKVAIALTNVNTNWKGDWGQINQIDYTIKNNEKGTILPNEILMYVEGYEDYEKKVPLPDNLKKILSGETSKGSSLVPKGFAYRESATGSLNDVEVKIILIDADRKEIARFTKAFNLQG